MITSVLEPKSDYLFRPCSPKGSSRSWKLTRKGWRVGTDSNTFISCIYAGMDGKTDEQGKKIQLRRMQTNAEIQSDVEAETLWEMHANIA